MPAKERIVLVHGTGAAKPGNPGHEKWWQPESRFARKLLERVRTGGGRADTDIVAFNWGGANSEFARREGGRALAGLLHDYDLQGIAYHLIGHSHGGSVIWHALTTSAKAGTDREGLRSWTTVGTPFLQFAPRSSIFVVVALGLVATAAMLLLLFRNVAESFRDDYVILVRDMPAWSSILVAAAPLVLIVVLAAALLSLWRYLSVARNEREPDAGLRKRLERFLRLYLPLWHRLDEPTSGLSASLARPPAIAPRAPVEKAVPWVRRSVGRLYNRIVPPVVDAFVWSVVTGRLQGRDMPSLVMRSCTPVPAGISAVANGLPADFQQRMAREADQLASGSAQRLRVALRELGDGRTELRSLGQAISWQEILHTTYFDDEQLAELCSLHVIGTNCTADKLPPPAVEAPSEVSQYYEPRALYVLFGLGVILLLLTVIGASRAVWESFGQPLTSRFQIDRIVENAQKPEFARLWDSPAVAEVAVRLVAIDRLQDPLGVLSRIDNPNTMVRAAQLIAYAYGFLGKDADLQQLGASKVVRSAAAEPDLARYISVFALAGAVDAGNRLAEPLAARVMADLSKEGVMAYLGPGRVVDVWFLSLLKTTNAAQLVELLGKWPCDDIKYMGGDDNLSAEIVPHLEREKARCGLPKGAAKNNADAETSVPRPSQEELRATFAKRVPVQDAGYDEVSSIADEIIASLDTDHEQVAKFLEGSGNGVLRDIVDRLWIEKLARLVRALGGNPLRVALRERMMDLVVAHEVDRIQNDEFHDLGAAVWRAAQLVELQDTLGQRDLVDRVIERLSQRDAPHYQTIIARIYLARGDTKRAVEKLWLSYNMKSNSYTNFMWIAELASPHDR